jgi:hypothetical protein
LADLSAGAVSPEVEEEVVDLPPWRAYFKRFFVFLLVLFHGVTFGWAFYEFTNAKPAPFAEKVELGPRIGGALAVLWPLTIDAFVLGVKKKKK